MVMNLRSGRVWSVRLLLAAVLGLATTSVLIAPGVSSAQTDGEDEQSASPSPEASTDDGDSDQSASASPDEEAGTPSLTVDFFITLTPSKLSLDHGEAASIVVVVSNTTPKPVWEVNLTWLDNATVSVEGHPRIGRVGPNSQAATTLMISAADAGRIVGEIDLIAEGKVRGTQQRAASRVAVAQLPVEDRVAPQATDVASAQVITALTKLTDRNEGMLFVQIENESNDPITLSAVQGMASPFLSICPAGNESCRDGGGGPVARLTFEDREIPPHGQDTFPFYVTRNTDEPYQTGKQVVVFRITLATDQDVAPSDLIVRHDFDTVVFGEAEILTPLGLTSIIILPGFVIVFLWSFLWKVVAPRKDPGFVDITNPSFWIIAITASLLAFPLYKLVFERDLLDGYDFTDVRNIWFEAVIVAVLIWLVGLLVHAIGGRPAPSTPKKQVGGFR